MIAKKKMGRPKGSKTKLWIGNRKSMGVVSGNISSLKDLKGIVYGLIEEGWETYKQGKKSICFEESEPEHSLNPVTKEPMIKKGKPRRKKELTRDEQRELSELYKVQSTTIVALIDRACKLEAIEPSSNEIEPFWDSVKARIDTKENETEEHSSENVSSLKRLLNR